MREEIRRIKNKIGQKKIYVKKDKDEEIQIEDSIVVMRDGEIRKVGVKRDIYESKENLEVEEFMGYRNRIKGKVKEIDGERENI